MKILVEIVFWSSILSLLHSYLLYPWLLKRLSRNKQNNTLVYTEADQLPDVSVIMAVYNEEKVIEKKIQSLMMQDYPGRKLRIIVGSDCSTDRTDALLAAAANRERLFFFPFNKRRGKPGVINELIEIALQTWAVRPDHILLITDANVILSPQTLRQLAKHFRNEKIAIVDAHMVHTGMRPDGISRAESAYISSEVLLKHREGIVWGKMIGPFGGCYALRTPYFSEVPPKFLVDDFYIAMRAFERGGDAISELNAICYEAVSHEIMEEYRRKSRISAGNFQNLLTFHHLWWPPLRPLHFAFFSHKVLRWLGPFFLLSILITGIVLAWSGNLFYRFLLLCLLVGTIVFPALDFLLINLKIHILPLRELRYFLIMNMALLEGFIEFVKGIKTNVWEPPKRH